MGHFILKNSENFIVEEALIETYQATNEIDYPHAILNYTTLTGANVKRQLKTLGGAKLAFKSAVGFVTGLSKEPDWVSLDIEEHYVINPDPYELIRISWNGVRAKILTRTDNIVSWNERKSIRSAKSYIKTIHPTAKWKIK